MLVRYSIIELLMVFEVSAQREHTIASYLLVCDICCIAIHLSNDRKYTVFHDLILVVQINTYIKQMAK